MRMPAPAPAADPARPMPVATFERAFDIENALAAVASEERRFATLGFELPLARCREQRRYWEFLRAVNGLADAPAQEPAWLRRIA
jgi:hypothetical protein